MLAVGLGLGFVTGLRCFTAPAAVCWAARLGWLELQATPFAFMGSTTALALFSGAALGEFITDQWSKTPSRVSPGPLIGRILAGGLSGACVAASAGAALAGGALAGAAGGVLGAVTGYQVRGRLVQDHGVKDLHVGLAEDVLVVALACALLA